ncbi:hypothetical protein BS78_10G188600 [Paspalum vaginatum]|nr:hypothetical protein BS78_10G188600 [Paspalum vaginatum]
MAQGGLAHVWNDWGIQILVLTSFTLQVTLLALAGIRRRKASSALRLLLWLTYQLADSTAIYTLGHLAVASSGAQDPHLVAFWAPFLLVHLGGPGTITAYALEDNRLWLRHLLTLLVQVLGAAFVMYRYIGGGRRPLLLLAAVLVFAVGVLRYGERTWALRRGNLSSVRSTVKYAVGEKEFNLSHWGRKLRWPYPYPSFLPRGDDDDQVRAYPTRPRGDDDEELLLGAHSLFHVCKSLFADATLYLSDFNNASVTWYSGGEEGVCRLAKMELSLMYDILYTKAAVVHTWSGYAMLAISPLATAAALLLFHFHLHYYYSGGGGGGGGRGLVNVRITYALLSGTLALETISVGRAMASTWACALMYCCGWKRLLGAVTFLRRRIGAASKRSRRPDSMGQFNVLHLVTRDRAHLGTRLAPKLGLQDWWYKVHFSGTAAVSTADLEDLLRLARGKVDISGSSRGVGALSYMSVQKGDAPLAHHNLTYVGFDDSILIWHIATDIYLSESEKVEHQDQKFVAMVQMLSNYMMFLLMAQPEMLPGPIRQGQSRDTFNELDRLWDHCLSLAAAEAAPKNNQKRWWTVLWELFQCDGPSNDSRMPQKKELATKLLRITSGDKDEESAGYALLGIGPVFFLVSRPSSAGPGLAAELLRMDSDTMLELIFLVWAEMLFYAANNCSRDSHARLLNNGGEIITVLWLWAHYGPMVQTKNDQEEL